VILLTGPPEVIELAEEIARRFQLMPEQPLHPAEWIEARERDVLLLEAA